MYFTEGFTKLVILRLLKLVYYVIKFTNFICANDHQLLITLICLSFLPTPTSQPPAPNHLHIQETPIHQE